MPLINLKTDLKSLGYGKDRKHEGSSNQPYIVTPIPDGDVPNSPDFLLRNGYLNPVDSLNDVKRLTKFFTDNKVGNLGFFPYNINVDINSINGLLFITKQELLERQNVDVVDGFNRIYNPLGTIAQAGIVSLGGHLNKQGFNFLRAGYFGGGRDGYYNVTKNNNDININRLTGLYETNKLSRYNNVLSINEYGLDVSPNSQILLSYGGGPNSGPLGIGKTKIKVWNKTLPQTYIQGKTFFTIKNSEDPTKPNYLVPTGKPNINWIYNPSGSIGVSKTRKIKFDSSFVINRINNYITSSAVDSDNNQYTLNPTQTFSRSSLGYKKTTGFSSTSPEGISDFRAELPHSSLPFTNYGDFNREKSYNASKTTFKGNVNDKGERQVNPNISISSDLPGLPGDDTQDIINFKFIIKTPENTEDTIRFRAYLDSWNDDVKADFTSIKYMGRAESFYKYNGFARNSSVSFLVPALSRTDMNELYNRVNILMRTTAPTYSGGTNGVKGLMRGVITYVKIGNLFNNVPSIITSVSVSEIEGMGWDINRDESGTLINSGSALYVGQLPKGLKVNVSFTPLHDFVPQYGGSNFIGG